MKKIRVAAAITAGALALSATGFAASPAAADPAADVQIILDNAPEAVQQLVDGIQAAVDALVAEEGVVAASNEFFNGLINAGVTLVDGTTQFGSLGLGIGLSVLGLQQALSPYLEAIDNPMGAGGLFDPEGDLNAILANLGPATAILVDNTSTGLAELLKGNLWVDGLLGSAGTPAAVGNLVAGVFGGLFEPGVVGALLQDTTLVGFDASLRITGLVLGGALGGFAGLAQLENDLAPIFDALDPALAPLVAVLEAI